MSKLRIIAGELGGRRIQVPRGLTTRPTSERVREALFSILAERAAPPRVLDAYAGTGALGFEALSRGAGEVVFVEADGRAVRGLRENATRLGVTGRCTILEGPALELVRAGRLRGPFPLILADPPYSGDEARQFLAQASRLLPAAGLLVLERAVDDPEDEVEPPRLRLLRTARYGRARLEFYRPARF